MTTPADAERSDTLLQEAADLITTARTHLLGSVERVKLLSAAYAKIHEANHLGARPEQDALATTVLHVYSCARCGAAVILANPWELRGGSTRNNSTVANPCPSCGKGAVEYVGKVTVTP